MDDNREAVRTSLSDPIHALGVIYGYFLFARAGGETAGYDKVALAALETTLKRGGGLFDTNLPSERIWDEFVVECGKKNMGVNEKLNKPAIVGVLDLAKELTTSGNNIVSWIASKATGDGNLRDCHFRLFAIGGVGPKLASFLIRDIIAIHGLEDRVDIESSPFLQPVDRWVFRASADLFYPDANFLLKDGLSEKILAFPTHMAQTIVSGCKKFNVSPIKYNQGAYYFGSQSTDEESFHRSLLKLR